MIDLMGLEAIVVVGYDLVPGVSYDGEGKFLIPVVPSYFSNFFHRGFMFETQFQCLFNTAAPRLVDMDKDKFVEIAAFQDRYFGFDFSDQRFHGDSLDR